MHIIYFQFLHSKYEKKNNLYKSIFSTLMPQSTCADWFLQNLVVRARNLDSPG
jgi:hypothetical protein